MSVFKTRYVSKSFVMAVAGIILTCLSIYFWKTAFAHSFAKGLAIPLLVLGLFCLGAGVFNYYNNGKRLEEKSMLFKSNHEAFYEEEVPRMTDIRTWWIPLRIVWTMLVLTGIVIVFLTKNTFVQGIAIGILIFGTAGHIIDGFAFERNEAYTIQLLKEKE